MGPATRHGSIAETVKSAELLASGRTPFYGGLNQDVMALANACLTMAATLERIRENDKTDPYENGAARPDGTCPPDDARWLTPREFVDRVLGPDPQSGERTDL